MGILSWILVGLVAGWLAGLVVKGGSGGVISDILLGIVGALVGGFLASALFGVQDPLSGFNLSTILIAFLGAVITVIAFRALSGRGTTV